MTESRKYSDNFRPKGDSKCEKKIHLQENYLYLIKKI